MYSKRGVSEVQMPVVRVILAWPDAPDARLPQLMDLNEAGSARMYFEVGGCSRDGCSRCVPWVDFSLGAQASLGDKP